METASAVAQRVAERPTRLKAFQVSKTPSGQFIGGTGRGFKAPGMLFLNGMLSAPGFGVSMVPWITVQELVVRLCMAHMHARMRSTNAGLRGS